MSYYSGFHEYVSVAEKKEKAKAAVEKLKKKNSDISPVIIEGRKLAVTWWGNSWNNNLVSYSDYSNRIGRGRSYVRNGAVLDLKISEGKVDALVQGSGSRPYKVSINIKPIQKNIWDKIKKECAGKIESLQEIVEGKFPKALQSLFTTKGEGLFPSSKEISFSCSCPDGAYMCKHVAAVLFGVGARLDNDPKLFFVLRNIKVEELISETIVKKSETLLEKSKIKSRRIIEDTDISDLFGIDIEPEIDVNLKEAEIEKSIKTKEKSTKNKEKSTKIKEESILTKEKSTITKRVKSTNSKSKK